MYIRKNIQEIKGITLIATVITVIVLLILSGISINMLSGENSILSITSESKQKTEVENAREQISLQVLASINNSGSLNLESLKTSLSNINADISNIEDILIDDAKTGKITLNGYDFYLDSKNKVLDYLGPVKTKIPEESENDSFSRNNGSIDIVFLRDNGYSISETANNPVLDKTMVPIYYDEANSAWKVCSQNDINWYNYSKIDNNNKWANVMLTDNIELEKEGTTYNTEDIKTKLTENKLNELVGAEVTKEGSMLVWIPRYAYKITYYRETTKTTIIGYSDSRGFVDTNGKKPKDMENPTTSVNVNGTIGEKNYEYYRPHPAFENDIDQGGWEKRIKGIWVGKFEATGKINESNGITTLPNTKALSNQVIGTLWNAIKNDYKAKTTESHMVKNSEWGAIIYLAKSKYGRNEERITRNSSSEYLTGEGDYEKNVEQSTTGNIYGIYDIIGGANEYVASYIANEQNTNGYQFASTDKNSSTKNNNTKSTKYATVYKYDNNSDTGTDNYKLSLNKVFGDSVFETSRDGTGLTSWNSDTSSFPQTDCPFFGRGSYYNSGGGIFRFFGVKGTYNFNGSRVVCIVK